MSTLHLVDPGILPVLDVMPAFELTADVLPILRAESAARSKMIECNGKEPEAALAPSDEAGPDVPLLVFTPSGTRRTRSALLHIHGGGMVLGSVDMARNILPSICDEMGLLAVSVDYRLAPETPFPGPQEDCYSALRWMVANADQLEIDPAGIIVMGESAGGGLAAALAHMVRDRGEYSLAGQVLTYPMIDHRTGGPECQWRNPSTGEFVWTRSRNQFGWEALRGNYASDDDRKGWFSPSLAEDLSGLPPTFLATGALDLFMDEALDYARRLIAAGVPVELHVYPGAVHGFHMLAEIDATRMAIRDLLAGIGRMVA